MVLRNDYVHKLFNGDIGIALPDASGELAVFFPDGENGYRAVPTVRMPEHETAFAMTVHKAQGSEFDAVLVLLPQQREPGGHQGAALYGGDKGEEPRGDFCQCGGAGRGQSRPGRGGIPDCLRGYVKRLQL